MEVNQERLIKWIHLIWVILACWVLYLYGMGFLKNLKPKLPEVVDFFQDYASARNHFEGLPVYTHHSITIERYLGIKIKNEKQLYITVNDHPPTSVLLAMPLAFLDYVNAQLVWNLISLCLFIFTLWRIFRELKIRISLWMIPPFIVFLLICNPLRQQLRHGQLNLLLLFILVEAWIADRSGSKWLSGSLIGVAASIKLFPGFMFLYFILRRRWQSLLSGVLCCILLAGLTAGILGADVYRSYAKDVMTEIKSLSHLFNFSIIGFWGKLFNTVPFEHAFPLERIVPIIQSPIIAKIAAGLSCLVVIICLLWAGRGYKTKEDHDLLYSLFIVAMLLVSPVTFDHAFLLLVLPFIVIWFRIKEEKPLNLLFLIISGLLCLQEPIIWILFYPKGWEVTGPVQALTMLAYPFYALVGFFLIGLRTSRK